MRNTIMAVAAVAVLALAGFGVKALLYGIPTADAEVRSGIPTESHGISPEEILRNHPNLKDLPVAQNENAI